MVGMAGDKKKVLFVCTGNTCRSPMAEGVFRDAVKEREDIEVLGSAGVAAYPGDQMSYDTAVVLHERGIEMDDFTSQPVNEELLKSATHVFAMTRGHLQMLVGAFPEHKEKCHLVCDFVEFNGRKGVDVPDPIGMGAPAYQQVAAVLDRAIPGLIEHIDGE